MEHINKPEHSLHSGKNFNKEHGPRVKPIHHRLGFWIGFVLIVVALFIYIASENLSIQPATEQTKP
jgi:hypothetical protein